MSEISEVTIGGIEAGGITFVASISLLSNPTEILEKKSFRTKSPEETLSKVSKWLNAKNISALGVASFGPIDINSNSLTYGYITTTPKEGWQNTDLIGTLRNKLKNGSKMPIGFQTDVNASALAENNAAINRDLSSCVYITVGGGVGVGISYGGSPFKGLSHGEGGHISVPRMKMKGGDFDDFKGVCKFHGDCVEGMVCAGALAKRLGIKEDELASVDDNNEIWDIFGYYMGQLCKTICMMICPEVIIIGGGVANRQSVFSKIRHEFIKSLGGYIMLPKVVDSTAKYITPAFYSHNETGIVGSLSLAADAYKNSAK